MDDRYHMQPATAEMRAAEITRRLVVEQDVTGQWYIAVQDKHYDGHADVLAVLADVNAILADWEKP